MRLLLALLVLTFFATAQAEDFRMETFIYVGDDEEFDSRTVSLFHNGVYYDLRGVSHSTTIYSPPQGNQPGRFVLLDPSREIKTEWTTDRVDGYIAKLTRWAMGHKDVMLRSHAAPKFTTTFDEATNNLKLSSEALTYDVDTQPLASPDRARVLFEFYNAFAELNCLTATSLPPGPRLALNRELLDRQIAAVTVRLATDDLEKPDLRSEHKLAWLLSKDDLDAIAVVNEQLVKFREVSNAEYHQAETSASK